MAWIVKNSATQKIDRSDTPYLSPALRAELEKEILPRYPTKRAALLPVLHAVQHEHHWLPFQALEEVAAFLSLTPAEVLDTASFYEEFWLQPKGRHLLMVCQSISCELLGHQALIQKVQSKLGIGPGETTEDGKLTLMTAECLGSCGSAPCALVNEKLHENLTADNLEAALASLE
jgi:NADH-quinone oxidoreductase subunit E